MGNLDSVNNPFITLRNLSTSGDEFTSALENYLQTWIILRKCQISKNQSLLIIVRIVLKN